MQKTRPGIFVSGHNHRQNLVSIKGQVLVRGSVAYEKRRLIHNGLCTHLFPDWIVVPERTEDVVEIVKITNKYNVPISVRSGGHSFTCTSTKQGKMVRKRLMSTRSSVDCKL